MLRSFCHSLFAIQHQSVYGALDFHTKCKTDSHGQHPAHAHRKHRRGRALRRRYGRSYVNALPLEVLEKRAKQAVAYVKARGGKVPT